MDCDILARIYHLRQERNWSEYKLSIESGIPQTTISSWYKKNMLPSIPSLKKICDGFGITMIQFFSSDHGIDYTNNLSSEQIELLEEWNSLSKKHRKDAIYLIKCLKETNT